MNDVLVSTLSAPAFNVSILRQLKNSVPLHLIKHLAAPDYLRVSKRNVSFQKKCSRLAALAQLRKDKQISLLAAKYNARIEISLSHRQTLTMYMSMKNGFDILEMLSDVRQIDPRYKPGKMLIGSQSFYI